jgi:hypothetical protein
MVYRKGELSKAMINREYPHQVALKALGDRAQYLRHNWIEATIQEQGWRVSPRGFTLFYADAWWYVHCFAERDDAETFVGLFGGVWTDPSERRGGRNWAHWTPRLPPESAL